MPPRSDSNEVKLIFRAVLEYAASVRTMAFRGSYAPADRGTIDVEFRKRRKKLFTLIRNLAKRAEQNDSPPVP